MAEKTKKAEIDVSKITEENICLQKILENTEEGFGLSLRDIAEITKIPESFIIKAKKGEKIAGTLQNILMDFFNYIIEYQKRLYLNKLDVVVKYYHKNKNKE